MLLHDLKIRVDEFERGTGWSIRPEGACRGDICVPLPDEAVSEGVLDVPVVAERMGLPLVGDDAHDVWALGPWSGGGRTLTSAVAPDLTLPDLDGELFSLDSLRGRKVLLLAWAPY